MKHPVYIRKCIARNSNKKPELYRRVSKNRIYLRYSQFVRKVLIFFLNHKNGYTKTLGIALFLY